MGPKTKKSEKKCLTKVQPVDFSKNPETQYLFENNNGLITSTQFKVPFFSIYRTYEMFSGPRWMTVYNYEFKGETVYYIKQYSVEQMTDNPNNNPVFLPHFWNINLGSVKNNGKSFNGKGILTVYSSIYGGIFKKENIEKIVINNKPREEQEYNTFKPYIIHYNDGNNGDGDGSLSDGTPVPKIIIKKISNGEKIFISFKWVDEPGVVIKKDKTFYGIYDFVNVDFDYDIDNNDIYTAKFNFNEPFEEHETFNNMSHVKVSNKILDKTQICESMENFINYIKSEGGGGGGGRATHSSKQLKSLCGIIKMNFTDEHIKEKKINEIIQIINNQTNGTELNKVVCDGNTLLHLASSKGYVGIVNALLKKGADINAETVLRQTPLDLAIDKNNVEVVKLLLDKNADIKVPDGSVTPLYIASRNGNEEIVKLLLNKGADTKAMYDGETAYQVAKTEEIKNLLTAYELSKKSARTTKNLLTSQSVPNLPSGGGGGYTDVPPVEKKINIDTNPDPTTNVTPESSPISSSNISLGFDTTQTKSVNNPVSSGDATQIKTESISTQPVSSSSATQPVLSSSATQINAEPTATQTPPTYIRITFKDNIPKDVEIVESVTGTPQTLSEYIRTMKFDGIVFVKLEKDDVGFMETIVI